MGDTSAVDDLLVLPLRGNDGLVKAIAEHLMLRNQDGEPLALNKVFRSTNFADGAANPKVYQPEEVKGKRVILVDTLTSQVNMNERAFARLAFSADALRRCGATEINLAAFPLPYSRQDEDPTTLENVPQGSSDPRERKHRQKLVNMQGEAYALDTYISILHHSGIRRIITAEVHNPEATSEIVARYYGHAEGVFYNLDPFIPFGNFIATQPVAGHKGTMIDFGMRGDKTVITGLDEGAVERAERFIIYSGFSEAALIGNLKNRKNKANPEEVERSRLVERKYDGLEGRVLIFPEDMFDSGRSVEGTLNDIDFRKEGMPRYVIVIVPYPINSGEAFDRIQKNTLNVVTMTFRPNIPNHTEYGAESINILYAGRWLAKEFANIMRTGQQLLSQDTFGKIPPDNISDLYEWRQPSRMVPFGNGTH